MVARPAETDEETPLLHSQKSKPHRTPIPWGQFAILLICQLAEPLTSQVINPFAPEVTVISMFALSVNPLTQESSSFGASGSRTETKQKQDTMLASWCVDPIAI